MSPKARKNADLQKDTAVVLSSPPMTVDFGHKISDTDHWQQIASDQKTGSQLLEHHRYTIDRILREEQRRQPGDRTNRPYYRVRCRGYGPSEDT